MAVFYKVDDRKVTCILIDHRNGHSRKYYGEATCSPEDVFNLEKGKKIAFNRARLMELGESEAQAKKTEAHFEALCQQYRKWFDRRRANRVTARELAKKALKEAYEA